MAFAFHLPLDYGQASRIARAVTSPPYAVADEQKVRQLFNREYVPGTFMLSERKDHPAFLLGERDMGYDGWLEGVVRSHLAQLHEAHLLDRNLGSEVYDQFVSAVHSILEAPVTEGRSLCDTITNQQATDITWRAVKQLITGDAFADLHPLQGFNTAGTSFAVHLLDRSRTIDPHLLFRRAVVAGILGCERKARYTAAGPSPVSFDTSIPLPDAVNETVLELTECRLTRRASGGFPICHDTEFEREVIGAGGSPLIVFFLDDLIETVFDLWAIQGWLQQNPRLRVAIVPRWGQYANDASFADVMSLLRSPLFAGLSERIGSGVAVVESGPEAASTHSSSQANS